MIVEQIMLYLTSTVFNKTETIHACEDAIISFLSFLENRKHAVLHLQNCNLIIIIFINLHSYSIMSTIIHVYQSRIVSAFLMLSTF